MHSNRRLAALLLCLAFLGIFHQAQAQTPAPASNHYAALADVLDDPQQREQLVRELRALAEGASEVHDAPAATTAGLARRIPGGQLAYKLQRAASHLQDDLRRSIVFLAALARGKDLPELSLQRSLPALQSLSLTLLVLGFSWLLARRLMHAALSRIDRWAGRNSGRRLAAIVFAFFVNLCAIGLSSLTAWASAILLHPGSPLGMLAATQLLMAFLAVEGLKAVARSIFSPRYLKLRLLPIGSQAAAFWFGKLSIVVAVTCYALIVLGPMIEALIMPALGQTLILLIMTATYIYTVQTIWTRRRIVARSLERHARHTATAIMGSFLRILAHAWHWLLLLYFTVLFVVSQTESQEAFGFMARATTQTLVTVLAGSAIVMLLSALMEKTIRIPRHWQVKLPSLERRLNIYIPAFVRMLRLLALISVGLIVLDAWQAFQLADWLESARGQRAIFMLTHVAIILLMAAASWIILTSIIEHRMGMVSGPRAPTEREKTLLMLFRSAAAVTISTLTVLVVLSQIGIDIGPLVAGAGVAGLAIGFGAQKLVQDVITGIFIQLENGMNQNDVVALAGLFGTVEKISIRSVVIRTMDGGYHLVPFSAIDKLANHTRDYGYHYGEYRIAHRENVDNTTAQLRAAFEALKKDPEVRPYILGDLSIPGVTALDEKGFTIRVLIKTTPGDQWTVQRAFNRQVKEHFDAAGIEIPYPQTVLHFGRDKTGQAAPLNVRQINQVGDAFHDN